MPSLRPYVKETVELDEQGDANCERLILLENDSDLALRIPELFREGFPDSAMSFELFVNNAPHPFRNRTHLVGHEIIWNPPDTDLLPGNIIETRIRFKRRSLLVPDSGGLTFSYNYKSRRKSRFELVVSAEPGLVGFEVRVLEPPSAQPTLREDGVLLFSVAEVSMNTPFAAVIILAVERVVEPPKLPVVDQVIRWIEAGEWSDQSSP